MVYTSAPKWQSPFFFTCSFLYLFRAKSPFRPQQHRPLSHVEAAELGVVKVYVLLLALSSTALGGDLLNGKHKSGHSTTTAVA